MKKYFKNIVVLTYDNNEQSKHDNFGIEHNRDVFHDNGQCNMMSHDGRRMIISNDLFKQIHNEYNKMLQQQFDDDKFNDSCRTYVKV